MFDLVDGEDNDIPLIKNNTSIKSGFRLDVATAKATMLLQNVCGSEKFEEFSKCGHITAEKNGFQFVLAPGKFVDCKDSTGRKARLCIHTAALSCHPIDEVIAAWLEIKYNLKEFMETAIFHNADVGFSKGWK